MLLMIQVDYGIVIWATFKCGGITSCANPSYTADELKYQLQLGTIVLD